METLTALTVFAIVSSVTPGPNVLMVASSAARVGWRATLPHMFGITAGFGAMLLVVGLGLAGPMLASPTLHAVLRWAAAIWLLWLAWKIATAPPPSLEAPRPLMGFRAGALFQWVNPKAWMICAAVMPTFTQPGSAMVPQVVLIAAVFVLVSMPCLLVWAAIGTGTGRLLTSPARLRAFNIAMGVLLAATLIPLFA
ncbi:LysE family translocator [Nostoc sp. CHAB 5836]|nr:LysE family translocator [Nostoc sp. CHAB 5836]